MPFIDIYIGIQDGRIYHFMQERSDAKPVAEQLTPSTGNVKTAVVSFAIKKDQIIAIGTAATTVIVIRKKASGWEVGGVIEIASSEKKWMEISGIALDGTRLYVGNPLGKVEIWDVGGKPTKVKDLAGIDGFIADVKIASGILFAVSKTGKFGAWRLSDHKLIFKDDIGGFEGHALAASATRACISKIGFMRAYEVDVAANTIHPINTVQGRFGQVESMCIHDVTCYAATWDGKICTLDMVSTDPGALVVHDGFGSMESILVDDNLIYYGGHHGELGLIDKTSFMVLIQIQLSQQGLPNAPHQVTTILPGS